MKINFSKDTLFYQYTTLIFLYVVANGLLFAPMSPLTYVIPTVFLVFPLWINFKYNKYYIHTKLIYIYIIYISILVFFSSDFLYSLKNVLKSFIPLLYFGVAIVIVNDYKDLNRLFRSMIILGYLFLGNTLISNIFNLGGGEYAEGETGYLQTGSIYSEGLNAMGYYLVLLPAIVQLYPFRSQSKKTTAILSAILIFIVLLLVLKRGSLLVVLVGYLVMFFLSEFKQRRKIIQILLLSITVLLLTFPIYEKMLISRYTVREDRLQIDSYETEGRYKENALVINDIFFSGNKAWLLFGHEVLNSRGNYGGGIYGNRQLHNDYAQVLNGSGIIGLGLYFLMNISILMYYLKLKKRLINLDLYFKREKILNMVFWAYFIAYFALGISGSIDSVIYNAIRFIFLGAIIGVFKNIPTLNADNINSVSQYQVIL